VDYACQPSPSRPPDQEKENRALVELARALADSPRTILQTLADTILEVCHAGSVGGTPRDFGPCGDVLDRNTTLLFSHLERRYTYFQPVMPQV
jgi:hypothetical protein